VGTVDKFQGQEAAIASMQKLLMLRAPKLKRSSRQVRFSVDGVGVCEKTMCTECALIAGS